MSNFYIPEPCHEKWDKMTPKEQGRHCDVCSKVVIDFTKKTDHEVHEIITGAPGNVCGHFRLDQLHKEAQQKVFIQPANLFSRNWKYFAMTVFGFFLLGKKAEAQKMGKVRIGGGPKAVQEDLTVTDIKLSGTIYTPDKKPAGGAQIVFTSGGKTIGRTIAIANGTYQFTFHPGPGQLTNSMVDIVVTYQNYQLKSVENLPLTKPKNVLNIVLENALMMLGQVVLERPKDTTVKALVADTVVVPETDTVAALPLIEEPIIQPENKKEPETQPIEKKDIVPHFIARPEDITATIYPSPAQSSATIYCNRNTTYQVELFDAKGTLQMSKTFSGNKTDLDVSSLSRGTYFVKVRDEQEHTNTMKLVKQ